jgi:hypothetical protein
LAEGIGGLDKFTRIARALIGSSLQFQRLRAISSTESLGAAAFVRDVLSLQTQRCYQSLCIF